MSIRMLSSMAVGLLLVGACSAGTQEGGETAASPRDVLTREQIVATNQRTAYDAIRQLQPMWLSTRRRSTGDVDPVWVYVDGARWGTAIELQRLEARAVLEVRYLGATDATTRYGTGHSSGALIVTTVR